MHGESDARIKIHAIFFGILVANDGNDPLELHGYCRGATSQDDLGIRYMSILEKYSTGNQPVLERKYEIR